VALTHFAFQSRPQAMQRLRTVQLNLRPADQTKIDFACRDCILVSAFCAVVAAIVRAWRLADDVHQAKMNGFDLPYTWTSGTSQLILWRVVPTRGWHA